MNVIVTGVAGFIGSHVAEILVRGGHRVVGIDNLSGGFRENVPEGVAFEYRSIEQPLDDLFQRVQPFAVYHLAAYAAEGLSHHVPVFNYINNLVGTANVLGAAYRANAEHFVFTSSIAAYGHPQSSEPFEESSPCHPCDPYGTAKLACEQHIRCFREYYKRPRFTIFRPHNVFGPRQNISDPYRNVVGIFMSCLLHGKPFPIFGDGLQTRSFSYITTVAECIASAPWVDHAADSVLNIGGDESMSVLQLGKEIAQISGSPLEVDWLPPRKEVCHAHCSHTLARRVFPDAYAHAISVREGLAMMYEYVQDNPIPPPTACPSPLEILDQLPPSWKAKIEEFSVHTPSDKNRQQVSAL